MCDYPCYQAVAMGHHMILIIRLSRHGDGSPSHDGVDGDWLSMLSDCDVDYPFLDLQPTTETCGQIVIFCVTSTVVNHHDGVCHQVIPAQLGNVVYL